jgi:hypothetical protein
MGDLDPVEPGEPPTLGSCSASYNDVGMSTFYVMVALLGRRRSD